MLQPIGDHSQQELVDALNDLMAEEAHKHEASTQMKSQEIDKSNAKESSRAKQADQGGQVQTLDTSFGTNSDVINLSRSNDNFVTGITGTSNESFDVEIQRKQRRY